MYKGPYGDPETNNPAAPAGCVTLIFILLLVLLALACAYTFYWHPSVEWLQSIDVPDSGGYVVITNFFRTLACNHAYRVCMGVPFI